MGAGHEVTEFWDAHVKAWLDGDDALDPLLDRWFASYAGTGRGAVTREGFVEPYIGSLTGSPRLAVLGLNPGQYHPELQSRTGVFADEIRQAGNYHRWSASGPYLRAPWTTLRGPNRYFRDRLRFTGRWIGQEHPEPNDMLVVELYPWHSTGVTGAMRPAASIVREFVWRPLGELDLPLVFAFGREWDALAQQMNLRQLQSLGSGGAHYGSTVTSRAVRVYELSNDQRLVVEWHSGSAGPPNAPETERLRAALSGVR